MSTNDDIFTLDVPAPLWQYEGKYDYELLTDGNRIFSAWDYRRAKRVLKRLLKRMNRLKIPAMIARMHELKALSDDVRVEFYELKRQFEETSDKGDKRKAYQAGKDCQLRQNELKAEYEQLLAQLAPHRHIIARATKLQNDINEHENWVADEKMKKRLYAQMEKEANLNAETVIRCWARLGYVHEYTHKGKTKRDYPKIERIIIKPDEIQYKILVSRLGLFSGTVDLMPERVRVYDLIKPDTLYELESALKRPVSSPHFPDDGSKGADFANGAWFVVSRLGVRDGLMERVPYNAVMGRYPQQDHHKIPLPMGVKKGRIINWVCLANQPHLLITGQTGSGKSNLINMIVATLISRHSPNDVRIILVDLKEGIELRKFASVPHAIGGLVDNVADTLTLVKKIEKIRVERGKEIGKIANDIDSYNAKVEPHRRMPRIVFIFDEIGALAIDRDAKKEIDRVLAQLAMKGRSSGVHLVIGGQTPYNDIVPNTVKANITITLEGRQRTLGASMSASGDKSSTELPKLPGRMWCNDGVDKYMVQVPYISDDEIKNSIAIANQHKTPPDIIGDDEDTQPVKVIRDVSDGEFLRFIIEKNGGRLHVQQTYKNFAQEGLSRNQVTARINTIIEQKQVTYGDCNYIIHPNKGGYKLVKASESDTNNTGIDSTNGINEEKA